MISTNLLTIIIIIGFILVLIFEGYCFYIFNIKQVHYDKLINGLKQEDEQLKKLLLILVMLGDIKI